MDGYVRLEIVNKNHIDSLKIADSEVVHNIRPDEKKIFDDIWNMYEKNSALQNKVSRAFIDEWDSFESLKKIHQWWDKIPTVFSITQIGRILAHTNAKRCDPSLPDLL